MSICVRVLLGAMQSKPPQGEGSSKSVNICATYLTMLYQKITAALFDSAIAIWRAFLLSYI